MFIPPDDLRLTPIELRKELIGRGFNDRTIAAALRAGAFARPRRGAYVDGTAWSAMTREEKYAVRCRSCFRQAQADVVLSHTSALPFLDAPLWGLGLDETHLTRRDGKTGRREAGVRQHCGRLREGDVDEVHGHPVSSPVRAVLEVATVGSVESVLVAANHFLHRGDFTLQQLAERYDPAMDRWPHSLATGLVLRLADRRIESVGESRTSYFFWRRGLPKPEPQFEVYDGGVVVARLDFALPELGVWIEFDGRVKYQKYLRAGEDVTAAVLREKRREEHLAELTGWRCFRITWADLEDPVGLERRFRAFLASVKTSRRSAS